MSRIDDLEPRHRPACWRYELADGFEAMAGKTDRDNDILTFRVAQANDYWFHVKSLPGSHVILVNETGVEPDRNLLKQAAAIAAYHSKARKAGQVPVSCVLARNVSKPRGAKAGSVSIRQEQTLKVRPGLPLEQ